ncbi:hypothetical protein P799_06425 [Lysinibacillus sphaericus CBAM5]|uniref:Uncharacterized protein n=1 Tax=Lysinibacillus sphaericus CBAM5 TaxID=1400869 RepID=W7S7B1_LYSSH|nr:hypothetical protein P799_06425 [Lysinibacillus sphaericus CBAM5]
MFKAHKFLPNDIKKADDKQVIQFSGFSRGLVYDE